MMAALRSLWNYRGYQFKPRTFAGINGYAIGDGAIGRFGHRSLLAWAPEWAVVRLMNLDLIAGDGGLTPRGIAFLERK